MKLSAGQTLDGYVLLAPLGTGATSRVFDAERDGERVAIKVVYEPGPDARARLAREVDALSRLAHPGWVTFRSARLDHDPPYIVMERVQGRTLAELVRIPPMPPDAVAETVCQLVEALAAAHERGVFHRDVKPQNVMVTPAGRIVVVDLGAATMLDASMLTATGQRAPATFAYAPPEWFSGEAEPATTDRYAVGVLLYELLQGTPAYPPLHAGALEALKGRSSLDTARLTEPFDAVVRGLTDPTPQRRPGWGEVIEALEPLRGPIPSDAVPETLAVPEAPPSDGSTPQQLGRYVVRGVLGSGGMGTVWRAWDPELQREVAIKVANGNPERLRQEAHAVARLDHPGIVKILDVGRSTDRTFLVMELVRGPDLREIMAEQAPFQAERAARWTAQVGRALAAAHGHGLVHRDVKPGNILLEHDTDGSERLRLTDFGLVADMAAAQRLTQTGQILGTPAYMAPEQVLGTTTTPATDVYALGVMLYELLTGQPPFVAEHPARLLHRVAYDTAPPVPDEVPGPLRSIAAQALRKEPSARYPDAAHMVADLERYLSGAQVEATSPSAALAARDWVRANRRWLRGAAAGLLGTVGLVALVVGGIDLQRTARRERAAARQLQAFTTLLQTPGTAPQDVASAFEQFAAQPDHRGTAALAQGWRTWGASLAERGALDDAQNAFAHAYAASDAADRRAVLGELLELAVRQRSWDDLGRLLDMLGPDGRRRVGVEDLQTLRLLSTFRPAPRDAGLDAAPVLRALALGHRTEHPADGDLLWVPSSTDGPTPYAWREGRLTALQRDPMLRPASSAWSLPEFAGFGATPLWTTDGPAVAFARPVDEGAILSLATHPPSRMLGLPATLVGATGAGDLDGDGSLDTFVGLGHYGQGLLQLVRDEGMWRAAHPEPALDASKSEITGVHVADLDLDGTTELVVTTGSWAANDVRVYQQRGDRLVLVARDKLGQGDGSVLLPRPDGRSDIVVLRPDEWPMPKVFGTDTPFGAPRGLHVLRWDGASLHRIAHHPTAAATRLGVGDFDGDGLVDLTVSTRDLHVFRQLPDGRLAEGVLRGVWTGPPNGIDLDGDGDDELVVQRADDHRLWVLGTGAARLPEAPEPLQVEQHPPPPAIPRGLRDAWRRAEELRALGRWPAASSQLEDLAGLTEVPRAQAALLIRAAEVAEEGSQGRNVGGMQRAVELFLRASTYPSVQRAALLGAARVYESLFQVDDALDVLARLPTDDPARSRIDDLQSERTEPFDVPLTPEESPLEILEPLHLRYVAGGGLDLDLAAAGVTVARLPVDWDGRRLGLELDLDVRAAEWDSGLKVYLQSEETPLMFPEPGVEVSGYGGAGMTRLAVTWGHRVTVYRTSDDDPSRVPHRLAIRLDHHVSERGIRVDVHGLSPDVEPVLWRTRDEPFPPGRYHLVLVTRGQRFRARLHALRMWGASQASSGAAPPTAWTALARNQPDAALRRLDDLASGPERDLAEIVALDDLDRHADAAGALSRLLRRAPEARDPVLQRLLRLRGPRFGPVLAARMDHEAWLSLFWRTFGTVIGMHPDSPDALQAATEILGPVRERSVSDRRLARAVLVARAMAWHRRGRTAAALDHLARALAIAPPDDPAGLSEVHAARARLAADAGDQEAALAAVREALAHAVAPLMLADQLAVDARLSALSTHPEWATVLGRAPSELPSDGDGDPDRR